MGPIEPKEFMIYYALGSVLALLVVFVFPRKRQGMRLRLGASKTRGGPLVVTTPKPVERPLNVIFNYNGESWDAYEVLGLPAGSSPEMVEAAYREELAKSPEAMRPFLEAAYQAVQMQWKTYRAAR